MESMILRIISESVCTLVQLTGSKALSALPLSFLVLSHFSQNSEGNPWNLGRVKKKRVRIKDIDGSEHVMDREEFTFRDPVNGWVTIENVRPIILKNGLKVTSHLEISGSCTWCGSLLGSDARVCAICSRLACFEHCELNEETGTEFLCVDCAKKLRRKRIIRGILRFILSPFVEKVE